MTFYVIGWCFKWVFKRNLDRKGRKNELIKKRTIKKVVRKKKIETGKRKNESNKEKKRKLKLAKKKQN